MSRKAVMFNRKASSPKSRPDEILAALELRPGDTVVDIGAGGGYFSLRFAEAVGPEGRVFAVDMNPDFLQFIKRSADERRLANVKTLLVKGEALPLEPASVDLFFMRNVTHHLSDRVTYFLRLKPLLKEGGRVAIIEYLPTRRINFHGMFGHFVPKETLVGEMRRAGYHFEKELGFLPSQSFTIYSKADS